MFLVRAQPEPSRAQLAEPTFYFIIRTIVSQSDVFIASFTANTGTLILSIYSSTLPSSSLIIYFILNGKQLRDEISSWLNSYAKYVWLCLLFPPHPQSSSVPAVYARARARLSLFICSNNSDCLTQCWRRFALLNIPEIFPRQRFRRGHCFHL